VSGRQTFHEELGEGNEAEDVYREHSVNVPVLYIANFIDAVGAAGVVHCRDGFGKTKLKRAQSPGQGGLYSRIVSARESVN
jgi:hypothetical protein